MFFSEGTVLFVGSLSLRLCSRRLNFYFRWSGIITGRFEWDNNAKFGKMVKGGRRPSELGWK